MLFRSPEKVIPVFVNKLNSGERLPIYGDGKNIREWIHVSDHARGIQSVLDSGKPGEIYNIVTGSHKSNNDLASEIINVMGLNQDMKSYIADRQGHDFRYSVDSRKIESLGFERIIHFNDGLKATIDWYLTNSGWWDMQSEDL